MAEQREKALKVTVWGQVNDGSIHPIGHAEGDTEDEVRAQTASLLRYWAADNDPNASFMELVLRYDEEGDA